MTSIFELGLIAGLVTFGGAYTTLPFIYSTAVVSAGWLSPQQFLDAVAIVNMVSCALLDDAFMSSPLGPFVLTYHFRRCPPRL